MGLDTKSVHTSIEKGYVRFLARLVDDSELHIFEYVDYNLRKIKYAYHYQDHEGRMIFRYDNEPHCPSLPTFPHHKHLAESREPIGSMEEPIENVLREVARTLARARGHQR